MANRKTDVVKAKLFPHVGADGSKGSGLQLRREIDRLAILLEQVRRQSERVQAAADAMGYNLVFDLKNPIDRHTRQDSKHWHITGRPRRAKVVSFDSGRERGDIQPIERST